jgi:general secretion pathway protein N
LTVGFSWITVAGFLGAFSAATAATSAIAAEALDAGLAEQTSPGGPAAPPEPVTSVRMALPPASASPLYANPLWGISLKQLSVTHERPVFSPSRRPPAAVMASDPATALPPPRRQQLEPPPLSLVGTIAGNEESFGIFLHHATNDALRLKIGEDFQGWKLRAIHGRQVTLEKDQQTAVLTLPPPGEPSNGEVQLIPVGTNQPLRSARTR